MFRRLCVCILIVAPAFAFAAVSKEMQELQRDVALLQEQLRQLQQSQEKALANLAALFQQGIDASKQTGASVAAIQPSVQQSLQQQESKMATQFVGLSTRMDQVSGDVHRLQEAVSDLTAMIGKLQSQLTDIGNAVKVLQTPAPPPPTQTSPTGEPITTPATASAAPPMSSQDLYNNALRDKNGGKFELALQEYADYLKWYGNTDLAPNAQFYIAWIHYSQKAYEAAANEFDMVLEKYPEGNKTEDALYYKGMSLVALNQKTKAVAEFQEVIKNYPNTDEAVKSCSQLKEFGVHCPTPAPPRGNTAKRKKNG